MIILFHYHLFIPGDQEIPLKLVDVRRYKQFAELHYVKK